jgi:hypothetical protein
MQVLDEIDLFLFISIVALPLAIPIVFFNDGAGIAQRFSSAVSSAAASATSPPAGAPLPLPPFVQDWAAGLSAFTPLEVLQKNLMVGVCRTADVFAYFSLLSRLNPVTHSVSATVEIP